MEMKETYKDVAALVFIAVLSVAFFWSWTAMIDINDKPVAVTTIEWGPWERADDLTNSDMYLDYASASIKPSGLRCIVSHSRRSANEPWQTDVYVSRDINPEVSPPYRNVIEADVRSCKAHAKQ